VTDRRTDRQAPYDGKDRAMQSVAPVTRNSADKPYDAFRGQSRLPNMVPFYMLGMVFY